MRAARRLTIFWLFIIVSLSLITVPMQTSGETSGEYLQKVMIELQELNMPSSSNIYENVAPNINYKALLHDNKDSINRPKYKINMDIGQTSQVYQNPVGQNYAVLPTKKIDLDPSYAEVGPHRNQVSNHRIYVLSTALKPCKFRLHGTVVTKMKDPEVLGLTRAELAAMYKDAIEKGSPVSLSALTNSLSTGTVPHVTGTHVEFPAKQPMYHYYFFPLKTFMSELKKDHGYKTIPDTVPESTEAAETSQTQLASPLFIAISTFISMALLFMMGVLFLPKFAGYGVIHARSSQDDFLHLPGVIADAIDRYYSAETFELHHSNHSRYNETTKARKKRRKRRSLLIVHNVNQVK